MKVVKRPREKVPWEIRADLEDTARAVIAAIRRREGQFHATAFVPSPKEVAAEMERSEWEGLEYVLEMEPECSLEAQAAVLAVARNLGMLQVVRNAANLCGAFDLLKDEFRLREEDVPQVRTFACLMHSPYVSAIDDEVEEVGVFACAQAEDGNVDCLSGVRSEFEYVLDTEVCERFSDRVYQRELEEHRAARGAAWNRWLRIQRSRSGILEDVGAGYLVEL